MFSFVEINGLRTLYFSDVFVDGVFCKFEAIGYEFDGAFQIKYSPLIELNYDSFVAQAY
jgi:hypothetical protein